MQTSYRSDCFPRSPEASLNGQGAWYDIKLYDYLIPRMILTNVVTGASTGHQGSSRYGTPTSPFTQFKTRELQPPCQIPPSLMPCHTSIVSLRSWRRVPLLIRRTSYQGRSGVLQPASASHSRLSTHYMLLSSGVLHVSAASAFL
jgi:hypothetical protein